MPKDAQHLQESVILTNDVSNISNNTGLWMLNLKTMELDWSREAFEILGITVKSKLIVNELLSLLTSDSQQLLVDQFKNLATDQQSFALYLTTVSSKVLLIHGKPVFLNNVENCVMGFIQEIDFDKKNNQFETAYTNHLEEMLALKAKENQYLLKKIDQVKRSKKQCLSKISHEVRTPVNAIFGYAHLIQNEPLSIMQKDQLQELKNSANNLSRLINHTLDVEKMETDIMIPNSTEFNPQEMIKRIVDIEKDDMEQKGITFNLALDNLPEQINGDVVRVEFILSNLLNNAVKYTNTGKITFASKNLIETKSKIRIKFEIIDTGSGISLAQQKNLFSMKNNSFENNYNGSALPICKKLTEFLGGRIGVKSCSGKGSCFFLELTFGISEKQKNLHSKAPINQEENSFIKSKYHENKLKDRSDIKLLLVEDSFLLRKVTRQLMESVGITIDTAENGELAIEFFKKNEYDIILMDVQMPIMDGLEATRQIRRLTTGKKIPIIALTANAFQNDIDNCFGAGMNDHISKPVDPEFLYQVILKWLPETKNDNIEYKKVDRFKQNLESLRIEDQINEVRKINGLDINAGIRSVGGNKEVYLNILQQFGSQHIKDPAMMIQKSKSSDYLWISERAHGIKGVAGTLGLKQIQEQAYEIEKKFKEDQIISPDLERLETFCNSLNEVIASLELALSTISNGDETDASIPTNKLGFTRNWSRLLKALKNNDTSSIKLFYEMKDEIIQNFIDPPFPIQEIENDINSFDFNLGLHKLEQCFENILSKN